MERLGSLDEARRKVFKDTQEFFAPIRDLCSSPMLSAIEGVRLLRKLREQSYENLNQIQHEHMIVIAAEWLLAERRAPSNTKWLWNPRQSGDHLEPDLRGLSRSIVIISAEVTTSEKPVGTIDQRMGKTLLKLSRMKGRKFYFVRTERMRKRARTKADKIDLDIEVVLLDA